MKGLSLKAKLLSMLIILSIVSLGVFGKISLDLYKNDKLAFIYESLANDSQAKSKLVSANIKTYDLLLQNLISTINLRTFRLRIPTLKFLQDQKDIYSVYAHIENNKHLNYKELMKGPKTHQVKWNWDTFKTSSYGLNLVDLNNETFFYKKKISINKKDSGFAIILFKNREIADFFKSSSHKVNFMIQNGKILSEKTIFIASDKSSLIGNIESSHGNFGIFEKKFNKENHIVAFSKIPESNIILLSMHPEDAVMKVQQFFFWKIMVFLVFIASVSLLVGTIAARWLTWRIDQLKTAAQEISKENFDHKIDFKSEDELGLLATTFGLMSGKIKKLLDELRRYNTELEEMVAERTFELQHLTNIQEAMLNSLGQGFVIFDKNNDVLPIYSKIAEDMFEAKPDEVKPANILGVSQEEQNSMHELFGLTFNNVMKFNDILPLVPDKRTNSKDQKLELSYAPINNPDTNELEYILIVGTDKTAELESIEKFNREWKHSQMITKLASNKFTITKLIKESLSMLETCHKDILAQKPYVLRDVQRYIHTIKGSFSYFFIEDIKEFCHDFETEMEAHYDVEQASEELTSSTIEKIRELKLMVAHFIDEYDNIIQYKGSGDTKLIPIETMNEFRETLSKVDTSLEDQFVTNFYRTKIDPFFQMYPTIIKELGLSLNKKIDFKMEGADLLIPEFNWEELFSQFIHFVRNSADHGIESPISRTEKGKEETGTILFKFELNENKDKLNISLSDDGNGIDWEKLAAKEPSVKCEADAIELIKKGGTSSKDEVSDISGRGVGVSSLFAMIDKWDGEAIVNNNFGQGLEIQITIPLNKEKNKLQLVA